MTAREFVLELAQELTSPSPSPSPEVEAAADAAVYVDAAGGGPEQFLSLALSLVASVPRNDDHHAQIVT